MQYVFDLVYDSAMVGIRESVRKLVNAWWNQASPQERYGRSCGVNTCDVIRAYGGVGRSNEIIDFSAVVRQAQWLIDER